MNKMRIKLGVKPYGGKVLEVISHTGTTITGRIWPSSKRPMLKLFTFKRSEVEEYKSERPVHK